jgi:uncharacterized repeat protein (TIGR02543 family)
MKTKRKITKVFALFMAIVVMSVYSSFAVIVQADETTIATTETTTGVLSGVSSNSRNLVTIESYLTHTQDADVTVKPCDIIFLLDQSKWMNTEEDNGAERQTILQYMEILMDSLNTPSYGEHRVAIAGYGRLNMWDIDPYDAETYPGVKQTVASLNTGYYTKNNDFQTAWGWGEVSDFSSTALPTMPSGFLVNESYDNVFMPIDDAKEVIDPDTMRAWYAAAARMDAGLTMTETLADIAKANDPDGDRDLIVCIAASSIPIQNNFTSTTSESSMRSAAAIEAAKTLKEQGATIFAFGDWHDSGKTFRSGEKDSEELFINAMNSVVGATDTPDDEKSDYFFPLSRYHNISEALNDMITHVSITASGDANVQYDVAVDKLTIDKTDKNGNPIPVDGEKTEADGTRTLSVADIIANNESEDWEESLAEIRATVEYVNFLGYYDGEPMFNFAPSVREEVPLNELFTDTGQLVYPTNLVPIPPDTENTTKNNLLYGQKVIITFSTPLKMSYQWYDESLAPPDVELPDNEYIIFGKSHTPLTVKSNDTHYKFNGWYYKKSDGSLVEYSGEATPMEDIELFGVWTKYAQINYFWSSETGEYPEDAEADGCYRAEVGVTPDIYRPVQDGYMFGGWYTDRTLTTPYVSAPLQGDIDLYAKWIPNADTRYKIEYYQKNLEGDGYTLESDKTLSGVTAEYVSAITRNYSGFTLDKVTYEDSDNEASETALPIKGDGSLVIKAYYNRLPYDVTYDLNGGTGANGVNYDKEQHHYGTVVDIKTPPTRDKYTFKGWSDGMTVYHPEKTYNPDTNITVKSNVNLTAVWEKNKADYKVVYYQEQLDGTYSVVSETMLNDELDKEVSVDPETVDHYHVNTTKSVTTGTVVEPTVVNGEDEYLTLTVYYDLNPVTVSYDLNNGTGAQDVNYDDEEIKYGASTEVKAAPTRDDYIFIGWRVIDSDGNPTDEILSPEDEIEVKADMTLKAEWEREIPSIYKVVYYQEQLDGTYSVLDEKEIEAEVGDTVTVEPDDIAHYHINENKSVLTDTMAMPSVDDNDELINIVTLKVYYDLDTATISYDLNDGTGAKDVDYSDEEIKYGGSTEVKDHPTRTGYNFRRWVESDSDDNETGNTYQSEDEIKLTEDITLTAEWEPISLNIIYDADGGTPPANVTYPDEDNPETPKYGDTVEVLPAPTKEGYSFKDWVDEDGNKYDPDDEVAVTDNLTLTAEWEPIVPQVIYDPDGGTAPENVTYPNTANPDKVTYGDSITVLPAPTKDGYEFIGWKDKDGNVYQPDDKIVVKDDLTLTAQWQPTVKIVYDINDGTPADGVEYPDKDNPYTPKLGDTIEVLPAPTRTGYTFIGWQDKDGNTYQPGDSVVTIGDTTLTAQWQKNSSSGGGSGSVKRTKATEAPIANYKISYETNGGTEYEDESYPENTEVQIDKAPVRDGYSFTGWYADEELTEKVTEITVKADTTVYAGWTKNTVPETLNGDDHFAYVFGYPDESVHPTADITRAEVAMIFFRLLKSDIREANLTDTNSFDDVTDDWYAEAVSTMEKLNIVEGRGKNKFEPNEPITRAEFAAICARFDEEAKIGDITFSDIGNHWAEDEIRAAANRGWVRGYEDNTFRPNINITRAEAMALINRVLERLPENTDDLLSDMIAWPDNADTSIWYYLDVQEATNEHDYVRKADEVHETWTKINDRNEMWITK